MVQNIPDSVGGFEALVASRMLVVDKSRKSTIDGIEYDILDEARLRKMAKRRRNRE